MNFLISAFQEAQGIILGDKTIGYYVAGFFFSFLAILLSLRLHSMSRDKESKATPEKFSWRFLIWDNTKRIVSGMIIMFILFRVISVGSNIYAMLAIGFAAGMGQDVVIKWIMDRSNILNFLQPEHKQGLIDAKEEAESPVEQVK